MTCEIDTCVGEVKARKMCGSHYNRWRKYGNPVMPDQRGGKVKYPSCTVDGCSKKHAANGMCQMHYRRVSIYGDPNVRRLYSKRTKDSNGYVMLYMPGNPMAVGNGNVYEHRYVMSQHLGRLLLPTEQVHHKNGYRSDNRIENLELWVVSQPAGQRVDDKIQHALEILRTYAPEHLANS